MEVIEENKVVEEITENVPVTEARVKLDCSLCTSESLFDTQDLKDYLLSHIKVKGKLGQLGKNIKVEHNESDVTVEYKKFLNKRYVKYLGRKFLRQKKLNSWVRLISVRNIGYKFTYYNVDKGAEE